MAVKTISIPVPTNDARDMILKYLKVLYQFHKLTDKEMELLTEIIFFHSMYKKKYDESVADTLYLNADTRKIIRAKMNDMSDPIFQNYLSNLRRKKVIIEGKVAKVFIPPVTNFNLVISFYAENNKTSG